MYFQLSIDFSDILTVLGGLWIFWQYMIIKRKESMPTIEFKLLIESSDKKELKIISKNNMVIHLKISFNKSFISKGNSYIFIPMIPANESKIEDISNLNLFFTETLKSQKETQIGFMEFYSENKENFYKCFIYIFNGNLYTGKIRYSYDQF